MSERTVALHRRALRVRSPLAIAAAIAIAGALSPATHAANWLGANVTTSNTSTDVDLATNWSTGTVPGQSDSAVFTWSGTATTNVNAVVVGSSAVFDPGSLELNAGIGSGYLQIDRSLTLSTLAIAASGTSGSYYTNRLRLGVSAPVTITLTGSAPLTAEAWNLLQMNSINKTVLRFTGSNVSFGPMPSSDARANMNNFTIAGGAAIQTAAEQAANPEFNFDAAGGTINIAAAGVRNDGNLSLGNVILGVRSDQTWNADAASFIRINYRIGATGTSGPLAIRRLDAGGARLDNLDTLNLVISGGTTGGTASTASTGMHFPGGEYGSLRFNGGSTSFRDNHLILDDNAHFKGYIVTPGGTGGSTSDPTPAAADTRYGLAIQTTGFGTANRSHKYLVLNGKAVTVDHSLLIEDQGALTTTSTSYIASLNASGSTVNVGGDITISSLNANPTAKAANASYIIARGVGIVGDATTVINVGGNYSNNVASTSNGNLASSTLNFIGGTGGFKTFEVADLSTRMTHVTTNGTSNLGRFNIGTATTPGMIRLVNDYLNDNPIALGGDPNTAKVGEKLITKMLNIATGSTLDVNGLPIIVGADALSISPTGTLDLHTGLTLITGDTVTSFLGLGAQAATWNLYASRVIDSSNPTMAFTAIESGGNTFWQAGAIPEPASITFVGLAALGLIGRRRDA